MGIVIESTKQCCPTPMILAIELQKNCSCTKKQLCTGLIEVATGQSGVVHQQCDCGVIKFGGHPAWFLLLLFYRGIA